MFKTRLRQRCQTDRISFVPSFLLQSCWYCIQGTYCWVNSGTSLMSTRKMSHLACQDTLNNSEALRMCHLCLVNFQKFPNQCHSIFAFLYMYCTISILSCTCIVNQYGQGLLQHCLHNVGDSQQNIIHQLAIWIVVLTKTEQDHLMESNGLRCF